MTGQLERTNSCNSMPHGAEYTLQVPGLCFQGWLSESPRLRICESDFRLGVILVRLEHMVDLFSRACIERSG